MLDGRYAARPTRFNLMPNYALTGSSAGGKSTILRKLQAKGAKIFDCDQAVHNYYKDPRSHIHKKIAEAFPQAVHRGGLNRKKIGEVVFKDKKQLRRLERIVHPAVTKELKDWLSRADRSHICIAEVALLFEKKLERFFDGVIVVYASRDVLIARLRRKFHLSRTEALLRITSGLPIETKIKKADFVIDNTTTRSQLTREVSLLWKSLCQQSHCDRCTRRG